MKEPRSVITKTLVVDRDPAKVFEFFTNVKNWESGGAIKNAQKPEGSEWWDVDTPLGKAKIRLRPEKSLGIFDHDFIGGGGEWTVFCRVTPNVRGSTVSWLFIRPEQMSQEDFAAQLGRNFDKEMEGYKYAIQSTTMNSSD